MVNKELLSVAIKTRRGLNLAIIAFLSGFGEEGITFNPSITRPWVNMGTPREEQILRIRLFNDNLEARSDGRPWWFRVYLDKGRDGIDPDVLAEMLAMQDV